MGPLPALPGPGLPSAPGWAHLAARRFWVSVGPASLSLSSPHLPGLQTGPSTSVKSPDIIKSNFYFTGGETEAWEEQPWSRIPFFSGAE